MHPGLMPPGPMAAGSLDFDASGYITPAGMVPPQHYPAAGHGFGATPVGYFAGHPGCDDGCDSPFGGFHDGCDANCGPLGCGGLLGRMRGGPLGCGPAGCGHGGCLNGDGFADLCYLFGGVPGFLKCLRPYGDAGRCAQRWYDVYGEAVFLGHNRVGASGTLTTLGADPGGIPVLDRSAVGSADLEAGFRVSGSIILGPGGNVEVTYIGNTEWNQGAMVSTNDPELFSFVSEFGTNPLLGFDDTDRSIAQSIDMTGVFHSGEVNYRRRTVGPNCRFQGSWLVGLRYVRFTNGLLYSAQGLDNNTVNANLPRFFGSEDVVKNDLFGAQIGGDLWWNMMPGISFGVGVKGAWLNNDISRRTSLTANSLGGGGTPGRITVHSGGSDDTVAGEFEATLVYRLSHSLSLRSSYYLLGIDDVAVGTADLQTIRSFIDGDPASIPSILNDRVVIQGVTFGAEYLW